MKHIDFWFDPVSPYAYLAFERLPEALVGLSYSVAYRPIVFAALLARWAHKGPAEIEPKRAWTFRQVHWLAHQHGITLATPARHPFNPIALSRLAWACAPAGGTPSRYVCERVLRHVWLGGGDAGSAERLQALTTALSPALDPGSEAVKARLRAASDEAVAGGLFGVPTMVVDDKPFWGFDALPMLAAYLHGDAWFDAGHWRGAGIAPPGVVRG